jgi:hypothetical protein
VICSTSWPPSSGDTTNSSAARFGRARAILLEYRKQSKRCQVKTIEQFREYKAVVKNVAETEELMSAAIPTRNLAQES